MSKSPDILFIVGMPRSGTKLLRDLLNEHSRISIPYVESQIFPDLIEKYGLGELNRGQIHEIHEIVSEGIFAYNLKKDYGMDYDRESIESRMKAPTVSELIRAILEHYGPKNGPDLIVGDKTPSYLGKIAIIRRAFPDLKLIHIIRDPRDRALSARNIWGSPLFDSAEKWRYFLEGSRPIMESLGEQAMEITYEQLLEDPEETLRKISSFLNIEFEEKMLRLRISTEKYGDARDRNQIDRANLGKYRKKLTRKEWKRIEEICLPEMQKRDYPVEIARRFRPLNPFEKKYLWALGGLRMLSFHIKDKGLVRGSWYFLKGRQTKKWKNK